MTPSIPETILCSSARLEYMANRYVFGPIGLTSKSVKIMRFLERHAVMSLGSILGSVGGKKSNLSQRLSFLERQGFVRREQSRNETDRRKISISLTPDGKDKLRTAIKRLSLANLTLEKHFNQDELQHFHSFFSKLSRVLDKKESVLAEMMEI